ncbi:MAG: tryptophan synthase alpha chain, partial [Polyangiales bacterium]
GPAGDGCGNIIDCGTCVAPETCGGGGVAGECGKPACTPTTCATLGYNCGLAADGCGGILDCGTCIAPSVCGGDGIANHCSGSVR